MNNGWIKLWRKFLGWEWYNDTNTTRLFIHLLLIANHKEGKWQGQTIKRGQLLTGRLSLKKATGISEQSIRTCLTRLKSTNEITTESTSKFSIITIVKYEDYQQDENKTTSKTTRQLTNHQPATNHKQECKEEEEEKNTLTAPLKINPIYEIATYYQTLTGKVGKPNRWFRPAAELAQLALTICPTPEEQVKEVRMRLDIAKWHYEQINIKDWGLGKAVENWNIILNDWYNSYKNRL